MKSRVFLLALTFLFSTYSTLSYGFSLPDEQEINKIVKLCSMGSTSSKHIEGESEVTVDLKKLIRSWSTKVKAQGKIETSEIGAILEKVKSEEQFSAIVPQYYQCVSKSLESYVKNATVAAQTEIIPSKESANRQSQITLKNPLCSLEDNKGICHIDAIATEEDTTLCISSENSYVMYDGQHISTEFHKISIAGKQVYGKSAKAELVKDIPNKVGIVLDNEAVKNHKPIETISLFKLETCDGVRIQFKNFPASKDSKRRYYYVS